MFAALSLLRTGSVLLGIMGGLASARPSGTRAVDEAGRGPRPDPGWPLSRGGRGILRTQEECPGHSQRRGQLLAWRKTNQLHRTNGGLGPAASPAPSQPLAVRFPPGSSHGDPGATTPVRAPLRWPASRWGRRLLRGQPWQVAKSFVRLCRRRSVRMRTCVHHTGARQVRHRGSPAFPSAFTPA